MVIKLFIEDGINIARCDALRINDHGDSKEEAVENLVKTVNLFIDSCVSRGTIDRVFEAKGIDSLNTDEVYIN